MSWNPPAMLTQAISHPPFPTYLFFPTFLNLLPFFPGKESTAQAAVSPLCGPSNRRRLPSRGPPGPEAAARHLRSVRPGESCRMTPSPAFQFAFVNVRSLESAHVARPYASPHPSPVGHVGPTPICRRPPVTPRANASRVPFGPRRAWSPAAAFLPPCPRPRAAAAGGPGEARFPAPRGAARVFVGIIKCAGGRRGRGCDDRHSGLLGPRCAAESPFAAPPWWSPVNSLDSATRLEPC